MHKVEHVCKTIQAELFLMQDTQYKTFNKKLVPNVPEDSMIGIRIPVLRKFAKTFCKANPEEAAVFMQQLPHTYFEENNLHAFFIECFRSFDAAVRETEHFLLFIDNWQTCDLFSPPVLKKHPEQLYRHIYSWLQSPHCYTVRYAVGLLLSHYLDSEFKPEMLEYVANLISDEYYVNMMIAWYFSTALVKQYKSAIPYIEQRRLTPFTHNKAIQKAVESRRISAEIKTYLKTLKIK